MGTVAAELAWQVLVSAFMSPMYTIRPAPALPAATEHSPGLGPGQSPGLAALMMELFSEPLVVTYLHMDTRNKESPSTFNSKALALHLTSQTFLGYHLPASLRTLAESLDAPTTYRQAAAPSACMLLCWAGQARHSWQQRRGTLTPHAFIKQSFRGEPTTASPMAHRPAAQPSY